MIESPRGLPTSTLIHGTINHGMNFMQPNKIRKTDKDYSRLATTYYHRLGPAGLVMEQFNWFRRTDSNEHVTTPTPACRRRWSGAGGATWPAAWSPCRAAASTCWSEPPYATIGLGTGTMASYGRPYQHVTSTRSTTTSAGCRCRTRAAKPTSPTCKTH